MKNSSGRGTASRPSARPFVGGRDPAPSAPVSSPRPRPFVPGSAARAEATVADAPQRRAGGSWAVAVYEPGMAEEAQSAAPALELRPPAIEVMPDILEIAPEDRDLSAASLALDEDVEEATRHADALAAADMIESVALRLRQGEILLAPGAPVDSEAAVVAAVLASLLGAHR